MGRKLNGTRPAACTRYLAKIRVVDVVVGVGVTGKVKYIEAVHAEAYSLAFGDMKVFEQRAINLFESRRALGTDPIRTIGEWCGRPIGAGAIIRATTGNGGGVSTEPVSNALVFRLDPAVLIGARSSG